VPQHALWRSAAGRSYAVRIERTGAILLKNTYEFVCMSYDGISGDCGYFDEYLHPEELEKIKRAVEKRRLEFLYGRLCAKYAYAKLSGSGIFDRRLCIFNDCCGAPFLEDGARLVGITHDDGLAAAIVTDRERLRVGIDVQKMLPEHTKVIYNFMDENEKTLFDAQSGRYGRDFLASAIWVAKESLSKLLEYGFSVYDALEVSGLEQKGDILVRFSWFRSFSVLLRNYKGFLFGFAAQNKDIETFGEDRLAIEETPITALTAQRADFKHDFR
jgi:4'-phosphopantetheinyl transferase EntD